MKVTKLLVLTSFLLTGLILSSCSDDDSDITPPDNKTTEFGPANVFTGDLISEIDGATLEYNSDGLLEKVTKEYEIVTFKYLSKTKLTDSKQVEMKILDTDEYYPDSCILYFDLGSNGFVSKAKQVYADNSIDTWEFQYNDAGQLIYMKRSEGDNEITNIKYVDGNITEVEMKSDDIEEYYFAKIEYTSEKSPNAIDNKGCLMLFDELFGIDTDEMNDAYFAGLLGRATKNMPLKKKEFFSIEDSYINTFEWILNGKGYPTQIKCTENAESEYPYEHSMDLKWQSSY